MDQLLAFRVGRLVDPINGPVPAGVYLPGRLAALGANYIDAGGAIVVSDHLDDTDADGLLDGAEIAGTNNAGNPTNPLRADTDGDGISDGSEVAAGSDPSDAVVDTHAPAAETDTYADANPPASSRLFYRLVQLDD